MGVNWEVEVMKEGGKNLYHIQQQTFLDLSGTRAK